MRKPTRILVAIVAAALLTAASACTGDRVESDPAALAVSAAQPADGAGAVQELTGWHEFPGFGYGIAYPDGWPLAVIGPVSALGEHRADLRDQPAPVRVRGAVVQFDHRSLDFMAGLGLPEGADDDALADLNAELFGWTSSERTTVELFDGPAIRVRAATPAGNEVTAYQAIRGDEIFILVLTTPSSAAAEAFEPTWQAMLASIAPTQ